MMQVVWTELIASLPGTTSLRKAASESALRDAERQLGQPLPTELAALLAESDGIEGDYGLGLVWPGTATLEWCLTDGSLCSPGCTDLS